MVVSFFLVRFFYMSFLSYSLILGKGISWPAANFGVPARQCGIIETACRLNTEIPSTMPATKNEKLKIAFVGFRHGHILDIVRVVRLHERCALGRCSLRRSAALKETVAKGVTVTGRHHHAPFE
jgi:hypothetical protein